MVWFSALYLSIKQSKNKVMQIEASPKFVLGTAKKNGVGIGNCAVLAITAATGLDYTEVETAMKSVKMYSEGSGTNMSDKFMQQLASKLGFTYKAMIHETYTLWAERQNWDTCNIATFAGFVRKNKTGKHVITNRGHAVAICDGHLIDNGYLISKSDKYNYGARRKFLKGFTITMNAKRPAAPKVAPASVSTSQPGTQLSIFG